MQTEKTQANEENTHLTAHLQHSENEDRKKTQANIEMLPVTQNTTETGDTKK